VDWSDANLDQLPEHSVYPVVECSGRILPMSERLMNLLAELEYQRRPYVTVRLREIFKESGSPSRVDFDLRLFRRGHKAYSWWLGFS
jgi:hypothetical protein